MKKRQKYGEKRSELRTSSGGGHSSKNHNQTVNNSGGGGGGGGSGATAQVNNNNTSSTRRSGLDDKNIWLLGDKDERERIRDFWINLDENERRELVKLEKEAVLKKMKEQQKQTCSCTVCGRRRNDIESQLEILYNTYYQELENFADQNTTPTLVSGNLLKNSGFSANSIPSLTAYEDEQDFDDDISDAELTLAASSRSVPFSDDEFGDHNTMQDNEIIEFGSSLTVQGGILTVADDFLKNGGRKFLDLMEHLAKRKARIPEDDSGPPSDNEWDDEDEEDSDEYEDDEPQISDMQRMEEGRRMFQIFAAKMFEERVLNAYREKAALDRAAKLLQELEEEENQKLVQAENQKRLKQEAKKRKIEKEMEKQRNTKLKEEQENAAIQEKREKEIALVALKEKQLWKLQTEAAAKEELRIQEKLLAEAKLKKEQKRIAEEKAHKEQEKQRKEEKGRARKEEQEKEKARKEEKERARKEEQEKARLAKAEEKKKAQEMARNEERLRKQRAEEKRQAEILSKQREEQRIAASMEKMVINVEEEVRDEKQKSRSLADEHSKKLKHRLESRAAREHKKLGKEKKSGGLGTSLKPSSPPSDLPPAAVYQSINPVMTSQPEFSPEYHVQLQAIRDQQQLQQQMHHHHQLHHQQQAHQAYPPIYIGDLTNRMPGGFNGMQLPLQTGFGNGHTSQGAISPVKSRYPKNSLLEREQLYHSQPPPSLPVTTSRLGVQLQPLQSSNIPILTSLWDNSSPPLSGLEGKLMKASPKLNKSVWDPSVISGFNSGNVGGPFSFNNIAPDQNEFGLLSIQAHEQMRLNDNRRHPPHSHTSTSRNSGNGPPPGLQTGPNLNWS